MIEDGGSVTQAQTTAYDLTLDRLTPGGRVRLARENLCLAMAVFAASHQGLLTVSLMPPGAELYHPDGQTAVTAGAPPSVPDQQSLVRSAGNQIRGAFALSVLQTERELAAIYGAANDSAANGNSAGNSSSDGNSSGSGAGDGDSPGNDGSSDGPGGGDGDSPSNDGSSDGPGGGGGDIASSGSSDGPGNGGGGDIASSGSSDGPGNGGGIGDSPGNSGSDEDSLVDANGADGISTARAVIALIAGSLTTSLLAPVWDIPPAARRRRFAVPAIEFTLDATGRHGQEMRWEHFGGLPRYLDLTLFISYCLDGADESTAARATAAGGDYGAAGQMAGRQSGEMPAQVPFAADLAGGYGAGAGRRFPTPGQTGDGAARSFRSANHAGNGAVADSDGNGNATTTAGWLAPDAAAIPRPRFGIAPQAAEPGPVDDFVAGACATGGAAMTLAGDLYTAYARWCLDNGYLAHSQRKFGLELTARGYQRKRRGKGRHWWLGVQSRE